MRSRFVFVAAALLALAAVACSSSDDGGAVQSPPTTDGTTHEVVGTADTNLWEPAALTVAAGDSVHWSWENATGTGHNVVAVDGTFNSGDPVVTGEFSYTFETAGTYDYYCTIHGTAEGAGMFATVTVS